MTCTKLIITCFISTLSCFCLAGSSDLIRQTEHVLDLRDQDQVLMLSRQLGKNPENRLLSDFFLAKAYSLLGKEGVIRYDSSLFYINKVIRSLSPKHEFWFDARIFRAHLYLEQGNYKACIQQIQELMQPEKRTASSDRMYALNVELLNLYTRINDLKSASALLASLEGTTPHHQLLEGRGELALGKYYLSKGNSPKATYFFDKARHSFEGKSISYTVDACHLLAEVDKENNRTDRAMKLYADLLHYEEQHQYRHGYILTLLLACETALSSKTSLSEMSEYVRKAYDYAKKLNNKMRLVQAEMNMGYYFKQLNQEENAIVHFKNALTISTSIQANYWIRSASGFLMDLYTQRSDYKNAFGMQQINYKANEQLRLSTQIEQADLVRNVHLMYTYRHEMEVTAYELERKQVHLIIWIAISIGTIGIAFLLFLLYLRQKRHNQFLTEKALKESERKPQIIIPFETTVPREETAIHPEKQENRPSLDESIYLDLQQKLLVFIETKGFLDPECSLTSMAKEFNTNTAYLSKYINEILNSSFNQLINEYRILDFIERVKSDKEARKTYTLDHLATLSGFSSKSTFIRAFKKQTGLAPSVFLKNLEEIDG